MTLPRLEDTGVIHADHPIFGVADGLTAHAEGTAKATSTIHLMTSTLALRTASFKSAFVAKSCAIASKKSSPGQSQGRSFSD